MTAFTGNAVTLRVEGMTCAHCVARVQKALAAAPGVRAANVDLETGIAEIRADVRTDTAALIGVVEAAGYAARAA